MKAVMLPVFKRILRTGLLGLCGLCFGALGALAQTHDSVKWSDGTRVAGLLTLTPGRPLQMFVDGKLYLLPFDRVAEIALAPAKEELVQAWRFVEAGQSQKVRDGDPYPVRDLEATVKLVDGAVLHGHLKTDVVYLEPAGQGEAVRKIVLAAKQRGNPGQSLQDLVYPKRITRAAPEEAAPEKRYVVPGPGLQAAQWVGIARDSLSRYEGQEGAGSIWFPAAPGGEPLVLAAQLGRQIDIAWPQDATAPEARKAQLARLREELKGWSDFMDRREVLAVWSRGEEVWSLLMLWRAAPTTLDKEASLPWRLEVLRWKLVPDAPALIAGRAWLFRGLLKPGEPPPSVLLRSGIFLRTNIAQWDQTP